MVDGLPSKIDRIIDFFIMMLAAYDVDAERDANDSVMSFMANGASDVLRVKDVQDAIDEWAEMKRKGSS